METREKENTRLDPLESRVERSSRIAGLIPLGSRILVGVSGGPDSMALLSILSSFRQRRGLEIIVLYCHHGLRAAADQEEDFVRQWAQRWRCTFASARLPVRELHQAGKTSLQEAARKCRYQALETQRALHQARVVALAHTANDQAEEVLIGLIRGAGLGGLGGIPRQRDPFVRPLLEIYRAEIVAYLSRKGIPWLEDASNRDFRFLRARIRHQLLPELQKYSPNILIQLNRMADLLRIDEDFLQEKTREAWSRTAAAAGGPPGLSRSRLAGFHPAIGSRLIQRALRQTPGGLVGLGSSHILTLLRAAAGPSPAGSFPLPGGRVAIWEKDRLLIRPRPAADRSPRPFSYQVDGPGKVIIRETGGILKLKKVRLGAGVLEKGAGRNQEEALVDWTKIHWPIRVSSLQAGDRFQPLGLQGTKKVSRFLMDRKIPRERRARIPLVWSNDRLVWVAGVEIAQPFALSPGSDQVLHLEFREGEKGIEISH
ncbi:MAG: tRNA lysidine(34) synthetase TilS [Deltaproteobacteria bacterium]|nr:tRNA lysidine(34) synthetase TilS [Deltaproteobacteria bacterium]